MNAACVFEKIARRLLAPRVFRHLLPGLFLGLALPVSAQTASPTSAETAVAPSAPPSPSPGSVGDSIAAHIQGLFARSKSAVVRVQGRNGPFEYVGTGFFVDPSGVLLTNYLVGGESTDLVVLYGEMKYPARRLLADPRTGIALLKVEGGTEFPFLLPGKSDRLAAAAPVMLLGYPLNLPLSPSLGLVASFDIQCSSSALFATSCIRASVPVQNGEAGGPLLNMDGEVVGIVIQGQPNHAGVFALPIEAAEKIRRDYTRFGEVRSGQVGIVLDDRFTEGHAPAVIADFVKDSPAQAAGVKKGDIIRQLGRRAIHCPADLLDACFYIAPGEKIALTVERHGQPLSFNLEAGNASSPHPESPSPFQPNAPGVFLRTSE